MFRLCDDFRVFDDNRQPYTLEVEHHTAIDNLHAKVENEEFCFNSIGDRFVFKTPMLADFHIKMHFGFTCLYEFEPNFTVLFHYDKKTRQGEGVKVSYNLSGKLLVSYISLDKMKETVLDTVILDDIQLEEEIRYECSVTVKENVLIGTIDNRPFGFAVQRGCGYLAIERKNYIGQWIISDFDITSEDSMKETVVQSAKTVEIPTLNGGDIPYQLTWYIKRINERLYIDYALSGGTAQREVNREDRPGQYVAERDIIINPYIKLRNGHVEEKIYLFRDRTVIADPNIYWDCLKLYWKCPELPVTRKNAIPEKLIDENTTVTYGYEEFRASGYSAQAGGPSEFVYDLEGKLLYSGAALTERIYELRSPADKKAVSLIPEACYNKWEVMSHLENNHYFMTGEDIHFTFVMRTGMKAEYIRISAEIRDVYGSTVLASYTPCLSVQDWMFDYQEISCEIAHEPMEEKLYRIVFRIQYGDKEIDSYERVFEVFDVDSEVSPAMASGLPFVFSMPNEQKWLSCNSFDLWNPLPSCDVEHYITAVTDTPIEAERKRVWEVIKPFKRQWFAWLGFRTCRDWEIENHIDVVKNADYLYYPAPVETYPLRNDFYRLSTYTTNPGIRKILREFLEENPQFASKLSFAVPDEPAIVSNVEESGDFADFAGGSVVDFLPENLKELLDLCHVEWFDYALRKLHAKIQEQNAFMKSINPRHKRSIYGPFGPYVNPTLSYHTIRSYGMIPEECLADDIYTGFAVFEDYPYSCSYQTYRGAFGAMTILLHVPGLNLYPEQYKGSSVGGCIDGAVKFAHAPMGAYTMEPYQNSTQMFEYVFNTPQRISGGYKYWNTYGFHRPDFPPEMWDKLVKDWKYVMDYKPARPLKTLGFVTEYTDVEDSLSIEVENAIKDPALLNRSEDAHGFLYDCSREAGLNAGFAMKFETLKELHAEECDILFLPTLNQARANASQSKDSVIAEIRRLYQEGVSLVAVSDITGLEDIFGVVPCRRKVVIDTLECSDASEYIYPMETELYYEAVDAEVLLFANGEPIIFRKGKAVLLNAAVTDLGFECYEGTVAKGRKNVSPLLKEQLRTILRNIANPCVLGENVGTTLFETTNGETVLMAIDYTSFDNMEHGKRTAVVSLNLDGVKDVVSDREILQVREQNGELRELRFDILPHETVFVRLGN